jgi:hypothetical protein
MSALTRKREQILVIAVATFYTGKAISKIISVVEKQEVKIVN